MKRWLLAVGALLLSAWTSAQADYVLIVYDLGVPKSKANQPAGGPGMMMGGPGNQMQDMMRRMQGGMRGGMMGGGEEGGRGMQGGPGRFGGGPGGRFGGGAFGGGFQNFFGNQNLEEDDDDDSATLKVSAGVEVKRGLRPMTIAKRAGAGGAMNPGMGRGGLNPGGFGGPGGRGGMGGMGGGGLGGINSDQFRMFEHKWGKTGLYNADDIQYRQFLLPPRDLAYKSRREVLLKDKTPEKILELARWVLANGKIDEFPNIMDDLAKLEPDDSVVVAYKKVKADMDRKITKDDTAAYFWKSTPAFTSYNIKVDADKYPHYVLLYPSNVKSDAPELKSRLERLEENYRAFFYWFALQGKALPVPDQRLVAILVDKVEEYQDYHKGFDNVITADDGFFARRENLVFFSATPQDEG